MSVKVLIGAALALLVVAAVVYTVLQPVSVFGVSDRSLQRSINRVLADAPQNPSRLDCAEREEGRWICTGERFGGIDVRSPVTVDDEGCWEIQRGFQGKFQGRAGCINVLDSVGL